MIDTPPSRESRGKRILLVEDDDANRQMLGDYLMFVGYSILTVATGNECIPAVQAFQPDVILLDLRLPDMSGYVLLKQLKETSEWATVPVIIISALAFRSDQRKALELGAAKYLVKPVDLDQLIDVIEQAPPNTTKSADSQDHLADSR